MTVEGTTELDSKGKGPDPAAEAAAQAAAAEKAADEKAAAELAEAEKAAASATDGKVDKTVLDRMIEQKRAANKEAKTANAAHAAENAKREKLEAKIKAIEDANKTEQQLAIERAEAKAKQAEAEKTALIDELASQRRKNEVIAAGVHEGYRDMAMTHIETLQRADPNLNVAEALEGMKKTHGALFNGGSPAGATAKGGPSSTQANEVTSAINAIEEKLKDNPNHPETFELRRRLQHLKRKQRE
jgi:hypothetical protein